MLRCVAIVMANKLLLSATHSISKLRKQVWPIFELKFESKIEHRKITSFSKLYVKSELSPLPHLCVSKPVVIRAHEDGIGSGESIYAHPRRCWL